MYTISKLSLSENIKYHAKILVTRLRIYWANIHDPCEYFLDKRELKINKTYTSGCCPGMSAQEIKRIAVDPMSCPRFRGCFQLAMVPTISVFNCVVAKVQVKDRPYSVSVFTLFFCLSMLSLYFYCCAVQEVSPCPRDVNEITISVLFSLPVPPYAISIPLRGWPSMSSSTIIRSRYTRLSRCNFTAIATVDISSSAIAILTYSSSISAGLCIKWGYSFRISCFSSIGSTVGSPRLSL